MDERQRVETTPVIAMRGIVKTFPGVLALDHVDFDVLPGEIHALVGKNGAGKSTLMHVLMGIYDRDGGEFAVRGERIDHMTTTRARDAGIVLVSQHAKYIPALSIAENVFAGAPPRTRAGFVDWRRLQSVSQ